VIKKWITEILNEESPKFDDDGNGLLDEEEAYTMMQSFNTVSTIDKEYFSVKFKDFDVDGDNLFDNKEMADFWFSLVGN